MLLQALARRRPVGVGLGKGWRPVQHSSLHAAQCAQVDRGAGMDCMDFLATRYTGGAGPVWTPPSRTMHTGADFDGDMGTPLPPGGVGTKVLLHSCCAPCSGAMIEEMVSIGLDVCIYFYNPNIHPKKEYELRKDENIRYAEKLGVPIVDADYDADDWFERAQGMEFSPERGARCTMCFDMRFDRTALYAYEHGYPVFTTTNATSRWKDIQQVNASGIRVAEKYPGVDYWVYNWQTDRMTERKYQINADNTFYKQQYCGCAYSLRDSNLWRLEQGEEPIKIGGDYYYADPVEDAKEESREVVEAFFADHDHRNQTLAGKKAAASTRKADKAAKARAATAWEQKKATLN